jgi:hypothetical protein
MLLAPKSTEGGSQGNPSLSPKKVGIEICRRRGLDRYAYLKDVLS